MTEVRALSGMVGARVGAWHDVKRPPLHLEPVPQPAAAARVPSEEVEEIEEVESPRAPRATPQASVLVCSGCAKPTGAPRKCDPCKKVWCLQCVPKLFEISAKKACTACGAATCCADWFENPVCEKCEAVYCAACVTAKPSERLGTDVRSTSGTTKRLCGACARRRAHRDSKKASKRAKTERAISEVSEFIDEALGKKRSAASAGATLEEQTQPWRCELPQCVVCLGAGASVKRARTAHAVNTECGHAIFCLDCSLTRKNLYVGDTETPRPCPVSGCVSVIGDIVIIRNATGVCPH